MKLSAIFKLEEYLPVQIEKRNESILYYFNQYHRDVLPFIKAMDIGTIFGEVEDHEEYFSLNIEKSRFSCYSCFKYEISDEGADIDKSAVVIREYFSAEGIIDFYIKLMEREMPYYSNLPELVCIASPEELFYKSFNDIGYEKVSVETNMRESDGYDESTVVFKNQEGKKINVFYPELDYDPEESIHIERPYLRYDQEINLTWIDFLNTLKSGDVLKYEGIWVDD